MHIHVNHIMMLMKEVDWMDGKFCYHEMLLVFPFVFSQLSDMDPYSKMHAQVNVLSTPSQMMMMMNNSPDWNPLSAFQIKNYVNFTSYKNTHIIVVHSLTRLSLTSRNACMRNVRNSHTKYDYDVDGKVNFWYKNNEVELTFSIPKSCLITHGNC